MQAHETGEPDCKRYCGITLPASAPTDPADPNAFNQSFLRHPESIPQYEGHVSIDDRLLDQAEKLRFFLRALKIPTLSSFQCRISVERKN
jgi:hypothetical protein